MTEPIASYATRSAAEDAIEALDAAGVDIAGLSIEGRGVHSERQALGFFTSADRMKLWARWGAIVGALAGAVFGGTLLAGELGSIRVIDVALGGLIGALGGGAAAFIGAAIASLGTPDDSVLRYGPSVSIGTFTVVVRGRLEEADRARAILRSS